MIGRLVLFTLQSVCAAALLAGSLAAQGPSASPQPDTTGPASAASEPPGGPPPFAAVLQRMSTEKAGIMKAARALLEARYDLSDKPATDVKMTRGKPVQEGVRVKLPASVTWESLSANSPEQIREKGLYPAGFLPLPHATPDRSPGRACFMRGLGCILLTMGPRKVNKTARLAEFDATCQRHSLPVTVQRRAIFEALLDSAGHPTADEIYDAVHQKMSSMSRTTVYRTLETLVKIGAARRAFSVGVAARFDANVGHHHHLLCLVCNKLEDIETTEVGALPLPRRRDFKIVDYTVQFMGTCSACAAVKPGARASKRARKQDSGAAANKLRDVGASESSKAGGDISLEDSNHPFKRSGLYRRRSRRG